MNKTHIKKMKKQRFIIAGVVLFSLGTMFSLIAIGTPKQDRKISISLTEQEWNIVISALQEMPMKVAAPVYSSIMQQAQQQLQAQQKPKSDTTKKKQ